MNAPRPGLDVVGSGPPPSTAGGPSTPEFAATVEASADAHDTRPHSGPAESGPPAVVTPLTPGSGSRRFESRRQLALRFSQLGVLDAHLAPGSNGTIAEPPRPEVPNAAQGAPLGPPFIDQRDLTTAPPPATPSSAEPAQGRSAIDPTTIVLGPVLGGGGMGIVYVAQQPGLRREVAVKKLRPERMTPVASNALLREAWVTGSLEHPNIVPIHLLLDESHDPQVVMKRIEGVSWDTLLDAPSLVDDFVGRPTQDKDRLSFHLRILMEVCHAVHFAHARGILHLDLKPENVMVGRFGEVYLVDWGIAAGIPGVGPAWLPGADTIAGVRGTPSWMAPELATAEGSSIGVQTDVYLLGGLLHAVLVNEPRHSGETVIEMLAAAFESNPYDYPASAPEELADLANRATSRSLGARPRTADEFRRHIESHIAHQSSSDLVLQAQQRLDGLQEVYASSRVGARESTRAGQSIRRDFAECRFAFQQALQIWPENPRAQLGLQTLLRSTADHALRHNQLERATECISELFPRDLELERRLNALGSRLLGQRERLRHLERDADANAFHRQRSLMALGTGLLFILWNLACALIHREVRPFDLADLLWLNGLTMGVFMTAAFVVRNSLMTTATNRRLVVLFGSGFVTILTFWGGAYLHSHAFPSRALDVLDVVAFSNLVFIYFGLAVTFTMDGRVAWLVPAAVALAVAAPAYPEPRLRAPRLRRLHPGRRPRVALA